MQSWRLSPWLHACFLLASGQRAFVQMHMNEQWPSLRQDVFPHLCPYSVGPCWVPVVSDKSHAHHLSHSKLSSCIPRQDVADGRAKSAQFWFTRSLNSPSEYSRFLHQYRTKLKIFLFCVFLHLKCSFWSKVRMVIIMVVIMTTMKNDDQWTSYGHHFAMTTMVIIWWPWTSSKNCMSSCLEWWPWSSYGHQFHLCFSSVFAGLTTTSILQMMTMVIIHWMMTMVIRARRPWKNRRRPWNDDHGEWRPWWRPWSHNPPNCTVLHFLHFFPRNCVFFRAIVFFPLPALAGGTLTSWRLWSWMTRSC